MDEGSFWDRLGWRVLKIESGAFTKLFLLLLLGSFIPGSRCVEETRPVEILVIGDRVPDDSIFWYDPSLRYRLISYPGWAQIWTEEEIDRWEKTQKSARNLVSSEFIIELPYHRYGHESIDAAIRDVVEISVQYRDASILLPVPQTTILAQYAPDETQLDPDTEGRLPLFLSKQNSDVLGGRLNRDFSIKLETDPLAEFASLISDYHDANLFMMEEPNSLSSIVAFLETEGALREEIGQGKPWLLRLSLSDTAAGSPVNAGGYVWKCASPLTGVFFFPEGGYVATSVKSGGGYVSVSNLKIGEEHEYAWDILSHIILFSAGREIPGLMSTHPARTMFARYHKGYSDSYRALEVADMVSSSSQTYPIWVDLARITKQREEAAETYRKGDVEGSESIMEGLLPRLEDAKIMAERALSLSLVLIHATEYSVVAATFLTAFSVTLQFVSKPRTREIPTTRRRELERMPGAKPLGSSPAGMGTRQRGLLLLIVLVIVSLPGLALFWDQISGLILWQAVFAGERWYETIEGEPAVYTGRLVIRQWSERTVLIDPSAGVAWVQRDWSENRPGLTVTHRFWPYELEREGAAPMPVYLTEGDEKLQLLRRYVGFVVDIRGKTRTPWVSTGDGEYPIQDIFELVPGAIRETET
jgi:hypothetical protein